MILFEDIKKKLEGLPDDIAKDIEKIVKRELPKCKKIMDFNKLRGDIITKFGVDIGLKEKRKEPLKPSSTSTTITIPTSTTSTTLDSAGDFKENLVIEPIGNYYYIWYYNGKKGVSEAYPVYNNPDRKKQIKFWSIKIDNESFKFNKKPLKNVLFNTPSLENVNKWVKGDFNPRSINLIFKDMVRAYKIAFDLRKEEDAIIIALKNLISWQRDTLDSFFYIGLDATRGAGKTCLLRAMSILDYHGKLAGDISTAFIARVIEQQKLTILVDEIDQSGKDRQSEIEAILRKGQRRNNTYLRINPNTYEPEQFSVHGAHSFSYRSQVEDALSHRALKLRLVVSSNIELPVINYHIESLFEPLYNEILFYYLENQHRVLNRTVASSQVVEVTRGSSEKNVTKIRKELFNIFTKDFSKKEVQLMKKLVGRNIELCYICLEACHILGLNLFKEIEEAILNKQEEEDVPESFQLETVKDFLRYLYDTNKQFDEFFLTKGDFASCFYYSKSKAYYEYVNWCKDTQNIYPVGTTKFNQFLKDLGFSVGYNIRNQKVEDTPVRCLIYSKEIQKDLGISQNPKETSHEYVKTSKEVAQNDK